MGGAGSMTGVWRPSVAQPRPFSRTKRVSNECPHIPSARTSLTSLVHGQQGRRQLQLQEHPAQGEGSLTARGGCLRGAWEGVHCFTLPALAILQPGRGLFGPSLHPDRARICHVWLRGSRFRTG